MPCETIEEFKDIEAYRKSLNPDLLRAKTKPLKFVLFEAFKFGDGTKGPLMALGVVPAPVVADLKKLAKVKAVGTCAFVDNVVQVTLKSGRLSQAEMEKALVTAKIKRACTVVTGEDASDEAEGEEDEHDPASSSLPPDAVKAGEAFQAAQNALEDFIAKRVAALNWHNAEIKTQQDAVKKISALAETVRGLQAKIADAQAATRDLRESLREAQRDESVAKYQKRKITELENGMAKQAKLIESLQDKIKQATAQSKELTDTFANKHGSSRHGAQTDLGLQARRAATGGTTPDQDDNVHGTSQQRGTVGDDGSVTSLESLKWQKVTIEVQKDANGDVSKITNKADVIKHLLAEGNRVATDTASKFHSHELEMEAVNRALAMVKRDCIWTEIKDGDEWKPLDTVTVYVGPPAKSAGWGFSMQRQGDAKKTVAEANDILEKYRAGRISQQQMFDELDVAMMSVAGLDAKGKPLGSVPMVKSVRVTLKRVAKGWTSITHFPDPTATPPGWTLTGSFVRKDARSPQVAAPRGAAP